MVRQVNKDYESPLIEAYVEEVRRLEEHFDGLQIEHVPRAENSITDHLSKCAAQKLPVEPATLFSISLSPPYRQPQWPGKGESWTMVSLSRQRPCRKQLLTACLTTPSGRAYGHRERGWCSHIRGGAASPRCRAPGSNLGKAHRPLPPNRTTSRRPR